jgi:hypothetical protein
MPEPGQHAVITNMSGALLAKMFMDFSKKPADVKLSTWAIDKSHDATDEANREFWRDVFIAAREVGC